MPPHEPITVKVYMSQEKHHLPPKPDRRNPLSEPPQRHATSADQIAHLHSLSTTDLIAQVCHLSGLPLIISNLPKQSPEPRKSPELNKYNALGQPLPHPQPSFDALAAARYKKTANCVYPIQTTLPKSSTTFHLILSFHSHPY